jgi:carbonic anhydrase
LNGVRYDMEMQIVHKLTGSKDIEHHPDQLCIIGVLFQLSDNGLPFLDKLNTKTLEKVKSVDFSELFSDENNRKFYHYKGSQTTPPCVDIADWFILKDVLPVSKE